MERLMSKALSSGAFSAALSELVRMEEIENMMTAEHAQHADPSTSFVSRRII